MGNCECFESNEIEYNETKTEIESELLLVRNATHTNLDAENENELRLLPENDDFMLPDSIYTETSFNEMEQFPMYYNNNPQQDDLVINGYIHEVCQIEITNKITDVIIEMVKQFHTQCYIFNSNYIGDTFQISNNGSIIEGYGYANHRNVIYTQPSIDDLYQGIHYLSINISTTPYDSFGYIGIRRKCSPTSYTKYFYKPMEEDWIQNMILTMKVNYPRGTITFYIGRQEKKKYLAKKLNGKIYDFVVEMNDHKETKIIIVPTEKYLVGL
eukprot:251093_1